MDKKYIQDLYNQLGGQAKFGSFEDFQNLISTDKSYQNDFHKSFGESTLGSFNDFSKLVSINESKPVQKKKFALESSSEVGSSVSQKSPRTDMPVLTQEGFEQAMNKKKAVPTDMSGKALLPKLEDNKKLLKKLEQEKQALEAEKKKFGDVFDKQLNIKPKVEDSQYLKDRLTSIDTDLINKEEEFVVPELEYQFGDLGFKFEESGATGDYVKVTAPNGKTTEISLDNFLSSKSKTQSDLLQNFIKQNAPAKGLFVLEKTIREQDKKFNSEKQVDESIKLITNDVNNLNSKQKQFIAKKTQFDKELNSLGPNPTREQLDLLEQQRLALNEEMKSILEEEETIKQKSGKLSTAVGKYSIAKSKQGGWIGGIQDAITRGVGKMSSGFSNMTIDFIAETRPNEEMVVPDELKKQTLIAAKKLNIKGPSENQNYEQWKASLTEDNKDNIEDEIDDYVKKSMKADLLPYIRIGTEEIFGDPETTKQWSDLKKEGFWGGAFLGVAESLPAMIGGAGPAGWAQRTAQMYAQISDGLTEEMEKDPSFKNISENEKLAITLPIGITSAALEAYGLRNIMASKGVISSLTMRALGKAGRTTSAKTFRELVENEVESSLARGLLTITAAGVAEFETGALQEASETGFKVLYDEIKGKDMFNTPDSKLDLIENIVVAGAQEAIGGFVLGVPSGVSAAYSKKGFLKMDDATFETFANMANDEKMQSAYIASLKEKITQGIITEKEAKEELNNYRNSAGLYRQLPDGLTTEQQKEAMNLLKEKRDLENFVEGKDAALVVKQKNRIAEINNELTKLSETDAVQEQTTDESVLRTEQPEVGLQEVGKGDVKPEELAAEKEIADAKQKIEDERESDLRSAGYGGYFNAEWISERLKGAEENYNSAKNGPYEDVAIAQYEWAKETKRKIDEINSKYDKQLKDLEKSKETITTAKPEDVKSGQKVFDILNRPATLFEFGGSKLEQPLEGDIYQDGQRVIFEDVNKNTYDLGNIDEVSDNAVEDLGIKPQEELMSITPEGKVNIGNNTWNIQSELPTKGIDYNEDGSVKAVSLKDDSGKTVMYEGQIAEDIAYQTLLKEFQTEEQIQAINEILDTDEELNKQLGEAEKITAETAGETTKPSVAEIATTEGTNEVVAPAEVDKIKSDIEASKERLKKAWDKYKTMGIAFDPKSNLAKDRELVKALVEYAYNNIRLGSYTASKLIEDLASQGFEMTRDGAKFIMDRASRKVQRDIDKTIGIKPKATEQKRINKAYSIGVATQKVATKEAKSEVKDLKGQVVDVFRAGIQAVKIVQATAKEKANKIKEISSQLVKDIKELESTGKITPTQALNMISKFNKVNMLNEVSVSNFIDYISKVFADADYDNKINVAKEKLKAAKKNINTKIGIADGLAFPLQTLFSINPKLIPIKNLERYIELVNMFSERKAVLQLGEISQVTKDVNDILDEINNEQSLIPELTYRLENSKNQEIKDGELDYAATIKKMIEKNEITQEEADLMVKYKKEIVPQEGKDKKTKEELREERKELESEVKKSTINSEVLPTRDERIVAKKIAKHLKGPFINQLSNSELKNLIKAIDNINNGYLPHQAQLILEKLNGLDKGKIEASVIEKGSLATIAKIYNSVKSKITDKDAVFEMIRRVPLFNIDQVLGNFKTKELFDALLGESAQGDAKFSFELKTINEKLKKAQDKVAKSEGYFKSMNPLKAKISSYKIKTYLIQLENDSNPGDPRVNPAAKYIEATIKHIKKLKSQYNENDVKILQDILDEFAPDGNIDINKLYNSFNSAEKAAIKTLQEIKKEETEKAEFTGAVIRGKRINPLNNHTHISVLSEDSKEDLDSGASFADEYNKSLNPSTKAKNLMDRTPGAKPINFDAYATAYKSAKYVLLDYYLTAPIRTARKSINAAEAELEKNGKMSKEKRRIFNAVSDSFDSAVKDLVANSYVQTSTGQDIIDSMSKQGYRVVLAGLGRSGVELLSNLGYIAYDPFTFAKGLEYMGVLLSEDGPAIMNNVGSVQTPRVYASGLSGKMIDTGILDQSIGTKSSKTRGKVINKALQVWNLTGKKGLNGVELTADTLIASPDKVVMRPYWMGSFITELEKQLGRKVTKEELKKIAENNEDYMNENETSIENARKVADKKSVLMGAAKNGFTGLLRGKTRPGDKTWMTIAKNFNSFMTNFMIYEYNAAKTGVMSAVGKGDMTKAEGAAVLAGVVTRMTVYNLLIKSATAGVSGLLGLVFGSDDDEEEEKTINQMVVQSLTSTFASLILGRDFGNVSKTAINYGFEELVTKEYLEGLRTGEYDPYKDAILFNSLQTDPKTGELETWENIPNFMGSYGPIAKTGAFAVKTLTADEKKEAKAIERQEKERTIRLPLEILGNAGYVPLYKEIRKSVMDDIYKDLKKNNKIDMDLLKRTSPDMYERIKSYEERSSNKEMEDRTKERKKEIENRMKRN